MEIKKVGVIGCGLMGSGIAQVAAAAGYETRVCEVAQELIDKGVEAEIADEILSKTEFPSLKDAVAAKMIDWKLRVPLQSRDAARLFRALVRLGYNEDAIREEIDQIRER